MRRRRLITFGSVLAMVLLLATLGQLAWQVASKSVGNSNPTEPLISWDIAPDHVRLYKTRGGFNLCWLATNQCADCGKKHREYIDCNGAVKNPLNTRITHAFVMPKRWGPFSYTANVQSDYCERILTLPTWVPTILLGAYPTLYLLMTCVSRLRRRPGHCLHCDYDLTGNESGVCPECGTNVRRNLP